MTFEISGNVNPNPEARIEVIGIEKPKSRRASVYPPPREKSIDAEGKKQKKREDFGSETADKKKEWMGAILFVAMLWAGCQFGESWIYRIS